MSNLSLARPYAKAIFELSSEHDCCQTWLEGLQAMAECVNHPDFKPLLAHPAVSQAQLVDVILAVFQAQPFTQMQKNLLALLAENNRLEIIPEILILFEQLWMEAKQAVVAEVVSAEALDAEILSAIQARLEKKMKKNILIETRLDPEVIAGARIEIGDWVMDGSLQTGLKLLKQAITH